MGSDGVDVIIVAAGSSRRMGGTDKLSAHLSGQPLLARTVVAFASAPAVENIVVVAAPDRREEIATAAWLPAGLVRAVVEGGARRQESVGRGFAALERLVPDPEGSRVLLVHDGARPLVSPTLVEAVADAARVHGAAIPVMPIAETVKRVGDGRVVETVERDALAVAQTPQGARRSILRRAHAAYPPDGGVEFTDEAALLEACRIAVHVIPGDPSNLKVTVPSDLARAESLLAAASGDAIEDGRRANARTGIGHDLHPFGPGEPLMLGGVTIAGAPRLYGHSDGDVVLHAVADALLGAAGLGDLGRLFPAGPATPAGIASVELLGSVVARLAGEGWRPAGVDVTIVGARPRLGDHLDAMRRGIAAVLGIEPEAINVKASTGNLVGAEGAGRAISALAIATVEATS